MIEKMKLLVMPSLPHTIKFYLMREDVYHYYLDNAPTLGTFSSDLRRIQHSDVVILFNQNNDYQFTVTKNRYGIDNDDQLVNFVLGVEVTPDLQFLDEAHEAWFTLKYRGSVERVLDLDFELL